VEESARGMSPLASAAREDELEHFRAHRGSLDGEHLGFGSFWRFCGAGFAGRMGR